jgi:hypothetical protein
MATYYFEVLHVLLLIGGHHCTPRLLGAHVFCITEGVGAERGAFHGLMAHLLADAALLSWFVGAIAATMTFLLADAAGTGECTLDFRIGAVCLVVADFAAIVALSRLFAWLRAVSSKVASLAAATNGVRWYLYRSD